MRRRRFLVALPGIGFALARMGRALQPIELTVLSSNATRAVLDALAPEFERTENLRLVFRFAPSAELKARIQEGEEFDVAFLASTLVDDLVALHLVDRSSRTAIARAGRASRSGRDTVADRSRRGAGHPGQRDGARLGSALPRASDHLSWIGGATVTPLPAPPSGRTREDVRRWEDRGRASG